MTIPIAGNRKPATVPSHLDGAHCAGLRRHLHSRCAREATIAFAIIAIDFVVLSGRSIIEWSPVARAQLYADGMITSPDSSTEYAHRKLGAIALVVGLIVFGSTLVAVVWTLAAAYIGGLGGYAVLMVAQLAPYLGAASLIGVVFGVVGVVLSRPRRNAFLGLIMSLAPFIGLLVVLLLSLIPGPAANP